MQQIAMIYSINSMNNTKYKFANLKQNCNTYVITNNSRLCLWVRPTGRIKCVSAWLCSSLFMCIPMHIQVFWQKFLRWSYTLL